MAVFLKKMLIHLIIFRQAIDAFIHGGTSLPKCIIFLTGGSALLTKYMFTIFLMQDTREMLN